MNIKNCPQLKKIVENGDNSENGGNVKQSKKTTHNEAEKHMCRTCKSAYFSIQSAFRRIA